MRAIVRFRAIALGLAITVTGCASPPSADVDAAKAAVDRAATDRAGQYATESLLSLIHKSQPTRQKAKSDCGVGG
jgi:hypothetical protein